MASPNPKTDPETEAHVARLITGDMRRHGVSLFLLSGAINILALTGSFYMLQVYDRALTSGSLPTLAALSVLALGLFIFHGGFDILRHQLLLRIGARLDARLAPLAHRVAMDMPRFGFSTTEASERSRDVDTLRGFFASPAPSALFDLPWVPVFLVFVYILHPVLGAVTLGGAIVLACLAALTELRARKVSAQAQKAQAARNALADSQTRNSDLLVAMGPTGPALHRFEAANKTNLRLQTCAADVVGTLGGISRMLRMVLQSALLGLGAYFVIRGQMSAGAIIAVSVASARALAPIDQSIAQWRGIIGARMAWRRLSDTLIALGRDEQKRLDLPLPVKGMKAESLTVASPSTGRVLLSDVSFEVAAGQAVAFIGPSGGGKSTLVRALTGVWPALRGTVRLDGVELGQWPAERRGALIGYMPQEVTLMDGTITENISRFDTAAEDRHVYEAANSAKVHNMILALPEGYQTEVGSMGVALSAGQRQRIALARAVYGNPFMVVLDEPNAALDAAGEQALNETIQTICARGGIAVVVAHRPSVLAAVDMVGVVQSGQLVAFGPKDQVLGNRQGEIVPPGMVGGAGAVRPANAVPQGRSAGASAKRAAE